MDDNGRLCRVHLQGPVPGPAFATGHDGTRPASDGSHDKKCGNGAPGAIRTPDPQIRSLVTLLIYLYYFANWVF